MYSHSSDDQSKAFKGNVTLNHNALFQHSAIITDCWAVYCCLKHNFDIGVTADAWGSVWLQAVSFQGHNEHLWTHVRTRCDKIFCSFSACVGALFMRIVHTGC